MKRILVTGGLGTVGAGLVMELRERGHHVVSLDLQHSHDEIGFSLRTDVLEPLYVRCDIAEYRQLERVFNLMGPFDFVYNCAAEFGRWNGEDHYEKVWSSNAIGLKNLLRLQEKIKFKLVHFSSSEVYGDWPNIMLESVMDEYEVRQMNDYAISKWSNEMQVANSISQFATETVIVRLFNTYGPGEYYSPYRSVNCRFIYCAIKNIPWVVFKGHSRTSTYLSDTVNALSNITNNFISGEVYNIGGHELHTIEQLSDLVINITGADKNLVEYRESEILTTKNKVVDVNKSIKDLGYKSSVNLEEGISKTVEWMKKTYI